MIDIKFQRDDDLHNYFTCTYSLEGYESIGILAYKLAIGQSIGNPDIRSPQETTKLIQDHACKIVSFSSNFNNKTNKYYGTAYIAFPLANIDLETDGISQILCQAMGGQMDIDVITKCRLTNIHFPLDIIDKYFKRPKYGMSTLKQLRNAQLRPLVGAIIKPKVGLTPLGLQKMIDELALGGVDFIKEDEIMANPAICSLEDRLPYIYEVTKNYPGLIYCVCINADPTHIENRVRMVHDAGVNGVHINIWSGLGVYKSIRDLDLPLFIHFQKSGSQMLTDPNNAYSISWNVICELAALSGVDSIHAGMWGGYHPPVDKEDLKDTMRILTNRNVIPALSCGMHPTLLTKIKDEFGNDFMANSGGSIHGHPGGSRAGAKAMIQAAVGFHGPEYKEAEELWGGE